MFDFRRVFNIILLLSYGHVVGDGSFHKAVSGLQQQWTHKYFDIVIFSRSVR
jgi:hypothetical protein